MSEANQVTHPKRGVKYGWYYDPEYHEDAECRWRYHPDSTEDRIILIRECHCGLHQNREKLLDSEDAPWEKPDFSFDGVDIHYKSTCKRIRRIREGDPDRVSYRLDCDCSFQNQHPRNDIMVEQNVVPLYNRR